MSKSRVGKKKKGLSVLAVMTMTVIMTITEKKRKIEECSETIIDMSGKSFLGAKRNGSSSALPDLIEV